MDDFYTACQEKVKNAADPVAAIGELAAISLHDLPRVQICKFVEQATTLLSVIFQAAGNSSPDLTSRFQQIRQQLSASLDYAGLLADHQGLPMSFWLSDYLILNGAVSRHKIKRNRTV